MVLVAGVGFFTDAYVVSLPQALLLRILALT